MKKGYKILMPLMLAVAVAIGIFLGARINSNINSSSKGVGNVFENDKLSIITKIIEKDYVDTICRNELIEKAIPLVLNELDPHSTYIKADEMKSVSEEMRGNFSGIGVQFIMQNDTVTVVDVVSGGPSQKLGILAGDRIVKVNGANVSGMEIKSDSIVSLLKGKKGTIVNVSILRNSFKDLLEFKIERDEIPLVSIDVSYMIDNTIGLIRVNRFAEKTHKEFVDGIKDLKSKGAKKLIIDLRGNSGGYLQAVFEMVDEFLKEGKMIVYTQGKSRPRYDYLSTKNGNWEEGDLVVLIDEYSASASEIFAGAIQDNDRGLIVGRRSFGKGLVQEQIPFIDGSALRLTVARFYTPSGRSIQKPYDKGNEEYELELYNRMVNDELVEKDSIHFSDKDKYYTTGGRIVYGGGGIMPDMFVPVDTAGINNLYSSVVSKNLIYYYAFDYADKNRAMFKSLKSADQIESLLSDKNVFSLFLRHIKEKGVKYTEKELKESERILEKQLYAYICRNIIGDIGFYPIIFSIDKTVLKAIELLKEDWTEKDIAKLSN
ncbi:MAG: S41 family peptidase [Prolixibacteraceae bacterium]|nr:S41 family peptidase [Prolixibacteraceae bacterium]